MTENERKGRERLEEALRKYDMEYYGKLPEAELSSKPSEKYLRAMRKLCFRIRAPLKIPYSWGRRLAACITVAFFAFSGMTALVYAYEIWQENFAVNDHIPPPSKIENVYLPRVLPDGYAQENSVVEEKSAVTVYSNGSGELVIKQALLYTEIQTDYTEKFELNGVTVYFTEKEKCGVYRWDGSKYAFTVSVPRDIDEFTVRMMIADIIMTEG